MSLLETIAATASKAVIERLLSKTPRNKNRELADRIQSAIHDHLREVTNWTQKLHAFDASSPRDLDSSTIHIRFDAEPRRFATRSTSRSTKAESDLLAIPDHYLLLGNPGSGKTTAIKRIARRLLIDEPISASDHFQFPLIIRLRELKRGEPLHCALASVLGLEYQTAEVKGTVAGLAVTRTEIRIEGEPIEKVLSRVLSSVRPLLLLDGLDEVWSDARSEIAQEISRLANGLADARVIVTSRTGDYTVPLEGFVALQLCPLTTDQIREIALKWLDAPEPFIEALERLPYRDIADRPLLLTQLLLLFRRHGFLPEQPAHVYKRVIRILLEDWDAQRQIVRSSKYAGFDPDRKSEFLAAIAFHLTYTVARSQFSEEELIEAYRRVHQVFNLPEGDAVQVAREIEAHTGIIVSTGHDTYEFSHLSIQEYLCASFLVRSASPILIRRALNGHTAPVAVAVALSSQPSEWLARLIMNPDHHSWLERAGVLPFLSRLVIERPFFEAYEPLGWAALYMCYRLCRNQGQIPDTAIQFLHMPGVRRSIADALRWYTVGGVLDSGPIVWLKRRDNLVDSYDITRPNDAVIPRSLLEEIAREHPHSRVWIQVAGQSREASVELLLAGDVRIFSESND